MTIYIYSILIGYFIGCLQSSFIISKFFYGLDIRDRGTGNAGASNMFTILGWKSGFITGLIDIFKAAIAVLIISKIFSQHEDILTLKYMTGSAVVLGHIYPFFMNFKGGKGAASYIGLILGIDPLIGLACVVFIIVFTIISNYISLASILMYTLFPIYGISIDLINTESFIILIIIGSIGILKHRTNIKNIVNKNELGFWEVLNKKENRENVYLILDFDSTIITKETLDELAKISLDKDNKKEQKIKEISNLTDKAMSGEISFLHALNERIKILNADKKHLQSLSQKLNDCVSPSFKSFKDYIKENIDKIYIVSGGFTDLIYPIVREYGIKKNHIFANSFKFDKKDKIIGVDSKKYLAQKSGKIKAVRSLKLSGTVIVVGDGWTDYQIKQAGLARYFIAYTESIARERVLKNGDLEAASFADVLKFINSIRKL